MLKPIENTTIFAVQELSPPEIRIFVEKWFHTPSDQALMLAEIEKADYAQVAATPLHLSNLCLIFELRRKLPETRVGVYEEIVDLRLHAWDEDRGIVRTSKYGRQFQPKEKRRFLAALAFQMGKDRVGHRFTTKQLTKAYSVIADRWNLPKEEAVEVAVEIESHTGVVVQSDDHQFEFYHLSIYEYLCAEYISRMQINDVTAQVLLNFPESCAMALELTSEPDLFLVSILDNSNVAQHADFWNRFLSRAAGERVAVEHSSYSGLAILRLLTLDWIATGRPEKDVRLHDLTPVTQKVFQWAKHLKIGASISGALDLFPLVEQGRGYLIISARGDWPTEIRYRPRMLNLKRQYYDWIIEARDQAIYDAKVARIRELDE